MAWALLAASLVLDLVNGQGSVFMFTVPFIAALITGKQITDNFKKPKNEKDH